jgi:hypothetical protein
MADLTVFPSFVGNYPSTLVSLEDFVRQKYGDIALWNQTRLAAVGPGQRLHGRRLHGRHLHGPRPRAAQLLHLGAGRSLLRVAGSRRGPLAPCPQ